MRKYLNVDVTAVLGAVMEVNTEHYKSDFRYDREMFREAALHPDGENNHLLWLSRQSGTECFREREVYLKESHANYTWCYHAGTSDACRAYAVHITGMDSGRVMGDVYELDYKRHVMELKKNALHVATVTARYEDGVELHLPYAEYEAHSQRFIHEHGGLTYFRREPEDENVLRDRLNTARTYREKETRPAVFKVRVAHEAKPSIRQQIAAGKQQVSQNRTAAPERAAKSQGLEV
jgi:hypothetical protein